MRLKRTAFLAAFSLLLAMATAELDNALPNDNENDQNGRLYYNNQNSTLIPLGAGGAALVSTVGIVAIVIGAIFLFSHVFSPNGFKNGGLLSPWLNQGVGYPGSYQNQYYNQPQAQSYVYEPYSKLGYQTQTSASR